MEAIKVDEWFEYIARHLDFTGCLIDKDNHIAWFKIGKFHREDGPACEWYDGDKWWYLNGDYKSEQQWKIATRKIKIERVLKKING